MPSTCVELPELFLFLGPGVRNPGLLVIKAPVDLSGVKPFSFNSSATARKSGSSSCKIQRLSAAEKSGYNLAHLNLAEVDEIKNGSKVRALDATHVDQWVRVRVSSQHHLQLLGFVVIRTVVWNIER